MNRNTRFETALNLAICLAVLCMVAVSYAWSLEEKSDAPGGGENHIEQAAVWHLSLDQSYSYKFWHEPDKLCLRFLSRSKKYPKLLLQLRLCGGRLQFFSYDFAQTRQNMLVKLPLTEGNVRVPNYRVEIFAASQPAISSSLSGHFC